MNQIDRSRVPEDSQGGAMSKIVLFSPDMDVCMSLRLLFQDRYDMTCTTDPDMLVAMVTTLQPQLVIADCLLNARMRNRLNAIRAQSPHTRIMFFCFSPFADTWLRGFIGDSGDVVFSKPIDLDEVTRTINSIIVSAHPA